MQLGKLEESESVVLQLLEESPENPAFHMLLGRLKLQLQQPQKALDCFRRTEELSPEAESLQCALGQAYSQLSKWDEAEAAFRSAFESDDESAAALNGLADIANRRSQFTEAVDYALQAVGLVRQFPPAHFNLGIALEGCGMAEEAVQAFETCLALAPDMLAARKKLDKIYDKLGRKSS